MTSVGTGRYDFAMSKLGKHITLKNYISPCVHEALGSSSGEVGLTYEGFLRIHDIKGRGRSGFRMTLGDPFSHLEVEVGNSSK